MSVKIRNWTAVNGTGQIHFYGGGPDNDYDQLDNLDFASITRFSHGHHGRSGGGQDVFNFSNTGNVEALIVGRIEDFDSTRDEIWIDGVPLDLGNLPSNVRLVSYNGGHNDAGSDPQQWLLIETDAGGTIFYALEGARVDMTGDGGSNEGNQEIHFLKEDQLPDFATLEDVSFVDPVNYVPAGFVPDGGLIIHDDDKTAADVLETVSGTRDGDLIAAGLNDDYVVAHRGNDVVWGGSGADTVIGGDGNDELYGGNGDDRLIGGRHSDRLYGEAGDDFLSGGKSTDHLFGGSGADTLNGDRGNDRLYGGDDTDLLTGGGERDRLEGGAGRDVLVGGGDADLFVFTTGDLTFDNATTEAGRVEALELVQDFEIGIDRLLFVGYENASSLADLTIWDEQLDGQDFVAIQISATGEELLLASDGDLTADILAAESNFMFA
ncbi:calcium-binding protein [Palleronia caenipelagi]|nr:calcium-binding protein [Palleronia caenipelagi]